MKWAVIAQQGVKDKRPDLVVIGFDSYDEAYNWANAQWPNAEWPRKGVRWIIVPCYDKKDYSSNFIVETR